MHTRQISHSKSLEACHGEITKLVDIAVPGNTKTPKKYDVNVFDLSFVFSINKLEVNYIFVRESIYQGTMVCNFRPVSVVE